MIEICHNIEPFMQPKPTKNPGGDCFACTLMAILQHLYPDNHPNFDTVFNYFVGTYANSNEPCVNNVWFGFRDAVHKARRDGYELEIENDFVYPTFKPTTFSHAFWSMSPPYYEWGRRLEANLKAGWLAAAEIQFAGLGPFNGKGEFLATNHFIAIDGFRSQWKEHETGGGWTVYSEAHIICSVKGAYWIDTKELLDKYGAAALWLIRKDEKW